MRTTLNRDKGRWAGCADGGFPPCRRSVQDPAVAAGLHALVSFPGTTDPLNNHSGLLLVNNDDVVRPETGFEAGRGVRRGAGGAGIEVVKIPPRSHSPCH